MQQIIAMGGGGFSMTDDLTLERYILAQTHARRPKVCFLAQASGDSPDYIARFYDAFALLPSAPNHLSLFKPQTADIEAFLLSHDVIYVGGGNTRSMLALWREWGLDRFLRTALTQGVVLAGLSAGAICWFEQGTTDSIPGELTVLSCLGYLQGSCTPHYDSEVQRRPALHRFIESGAILPGYAFEDGVAGHFIDGRLHKVVRASPDKRGYYVERIAGRVEERLLT